MCQKRETTEQAKKRNQRRSMTKHFDDRDRFREESLNLKLSNKTSRADVELIRLISELFVFHLRRHVELSSFYFFLLSQHVDVWFGSPDNENAFSTFKRRSVICL